VRLLPFLFVLYITNYLDRTSVAYAAIGMSRDLGFSDRVFGMGAGIFFISLRGFADSRRSARRVLECAPHDFNDDDRVGIADGAHSAGAHTGSALSRPLRVRRGGGRIFSGSDRLPESLVCPCGSRQGHEQLHGGDSVVIRYRLPIAGWILGHTWSAIEGWRWLFVLEDCQPFYWRYCVFLSHGLAWRSNLAHYRDQAMD